jgi:predicted transcriptional regulator
MSDPMAEGWRPHPPKVKRQITISQEIEDKLTRLAQENRTTPSLIVEDALSEYNPTLER